jgi:hypothetical protein
MFLNIITPCSRPQNLHTISSSINIPKESYRWLVVYDGNELPSRDLIPDNCEIYAYRDPDSCYGHQQRNFGMDLISSGHIYFNDDDTIVHPDLWESIKDLENDFISFNQSTKEGMPRLIDSGVRVGGIDSHNFMFAKEISNGLRFCNEYVADGIFAIDVHHRSTNPIHISKILSVYNYLR